MSAKSVLINIFLILSVFIVVSCSSSKKAAQENPKPAWVMQKPMESGYYSGVGYAPKVGTATQYTANARKRALNDMAGSISSTVSSTSVLHKMENHYGNTEAFSQIIEVKTNEYLEGFQPVDSYETETDYWVFYKISKEKYRAKKAEKKKKAVDNAKAKYQLASEKQHNGDALSALKAYIQAIAALKNYLGEACMVEIDGQEKELGSYLLSQIEALRQSINIVPKEKSIAVKRHEIALHPIVLNVNYNAKPLKNVPVKLHYTGAYLTNNQVSSGANGSVTVIITSSSPVMKNNKLTAQLNWKSIVSNATSDMTIRRFLRPVNMPETRVNIKTLPPVVFIQVDGTENVNALLKQAKITAQKHNVEITREASQADFQLHIKVNVTNGSTAGGLTSVYVAGETRLLNSKGREKGKKTSHKIRGVGNTREQALSEAIESLAPHITNSHIPALLESI